MYLGAPEKPVSARRLPIIRNFAARERHTRAFLAKRSPERSSPTRAYRPEIGDAVSRKSPGHWALQRRDRRSQKRSFCASVQRPWLELGAGRIILLEWIIHARHLHGMHKSRSFINPPALPALLLCENPRFVFLLLPRSPNDVQRIAERIVNYRGMIENSICA